MAEIKKLLINFMLAQSRMGLSERVNALRRLQAESQVELDVLLPSVLDRAF